ncbi:MAG: hypothetical protein EOM21_18630 [Gammaproteobacteria bacterium]|nr:hypothetical protein [Gammaproteobacteria bacterium]
MTIAVGTVSLAALLGMTWFASHSMRAMSASMTDVRMQKTAELIRLVLSDAIVANDLAKIEEVTKYILEADYGVHRMCVFDQYDRRVSQCRCVQADDKPHPGSVIIESPVMAGDTLVGYVGVAYDAHQQYASIEEIEHMMFLISVGVFLFSVAVMYYIGALFGKEVAAIEAAFGSMTINGEIRPLRKTPFAELESISESFNALIESQRKSQ